MERVDKHVRAVKRNPGCDATIAESSDNVSFGSACKAGFGQPSRQFAEEPFIHGATIQKSMPRPRHISNSWLCVTWLKLGNSKTEGLPLIAITLNVAIHVRTYSLPITSVAHFRLVPRTEWWLLWFIAGHRGRPGQGFLYRITVDRIGASGSMAS